MARRDKININAKSDATERQNNQSRSALLVPEGVSIIKIDSDKTRKFDIIPFFVSGKREHPDNKRLKKGDPHWEWMVYVHNNIGVNKDKIPCPAKMFGKPCPICEDLQKRAQDPEFTKEMATALRPKQNPQVFNVIDRADKEKGIQIFPYSYHNFGKLLDARLAKGGKDRAGFANPEGGKTLVTEWKKETGAGYSWYECTSIDFEDRKDYKDSIVDEAHALDMLCKKLDYDTIKKIYKGASSEEEDDDEDTDDDGEQFSIGDTVKFERKGKMAEGKITEIDEDEKTLTVKMGKKTIVLGFNDVEAGDDDDDDDDDKKKKKPAKGKKGKKGKKDEDDEEDDDDEEEEDDEDDEEDDEDDDEEDDEEDDEDDDEDDDDDDDDDKKKKKKTKKKKK